MGPRVFGIASDATDCKEKKKKKRKVVWTSPAKSVAKLISPARDISNSVISDPEFKKKGTEILKHTRIKNLLVALL